MKKKLKDLTISEIIEIANEYNGKGVCDICPLCNLCKIYVIDCNNFCDLTMYEQLKVEQELEKEIDYD